ncbi:sensor histidine kinase [Methylobacterium mesophilicum SR1.6/6]|uniref:C4-dicarboxylate transport sensor protein DctB n=1 Tax=Methylobacterium mesophilicum SR1.6/6 TaxID=908290 RepID=A0A6B9FXT5_9HYPH|nr:ATP-binding protein [Methylobacterium mesophilicum]QGY06209.1 sensor histidine kinase [Methylobacterium mesophilicum SR1.6/6]
MPGRGLIVLACLCAIVTAAWLAGRAAERWALTDLRRGARSAIGLQVGLLLAEMQKQASLPLALAADPEVAAAVASGAGRELLDRVDRRLSEVAAATGAAVIYVIGAEGVTVAASNAGGDGSFVGRDYAFRPYFRQAVTEGAGSQFALGTVSGRPGLYLARRIGAAVGVVVVKVEFDAVEAAWRAAQEVTFVTDARGIVLVTSEPSWRFGTLDALDAAERARIKAGREFGTAALERLPLHATGQADVSRIGRGALPAWTAITTQAPVPGTGWTLHTLTPVGTTVERERLQAWIIAALTTALAGFGAVALADRGRRTRARLAEAASRRAELESRVAERTRALREANAQLRAEIEERQRAEAERERLGRELAQAGRLAALGQFAASMAHEINQPLAAIRSYADNTAVLVRRGRTEDAAENAAAIGRLTDRIAGLTRQLKGFARRASPRREPVPLGGVLDNALELVRARAAALGVPLEADASDPELRVLGDGPRLEQVLVNLLQNALDAVAGRPDARVGLRVDAAVSERVAVEVTDSGPGIPTAERGQVFDAFFTTKSDGLGLGLAIARGIVEDCGGNLTLVCEPGGGTVFRMELIRAAGADRASGQRVGAAQ